MISGPTPGAETTTLHFQYDAWNRLVKVTDDSETPVTIATYAYDGQGRRVSKTVGETTTHFLYNENWQVLETREGTSTTPKEQYLWDPRYVDAPVLRWRTVGETTETLYYTTDANYNVTALIDPTTGEAVERYAYDAYGKATIMDGDWNLTEVSGHADGTASAYANAIGFGGYYLDAETGLSLAQHRYYHPTLGIWTGPDPGGYVDGMNLYQYCRSNPVRSTDPMGLEGDDPQEEDDPEAEPPSGGQSSSPSGTGSTAGQQNQPTFGDIVSYEVSHPMTTVGFGLKMLGNLIAGKMNGLERNVNDLTSAVQDNYSSSSRSEYTVAGRDIAQGALNSVNGTQDAVIGFANLPAIFFNIGSWAVGAQTQAPYIPSPDWSQGLIETEFGTHSASKFIGGQAVITGLTLGLSEFGAAGEAANLGHVTTEAGAQAIRASGEAVGAEGVIENSAHGGIFALSNPSDSTLINAWRSMTSLSGSSAEVVPIAGDAAASFAPIPVTGPVTGLLRVSGAYFAETTSVNLTTGATGAVPSLLRTAGTLWLPDMALSTTVNATLQDISLNGSRGTDSIIQGALDLQGRRP